MCLKGWVTIESGGVIGGVVDGDGGLLVGEGQWEWVTNTLFISPAAPIHICELWCIKILTEVDNGG